MRWTFSMHRALQGPAQAGRAEPVLDNAVFNPLWAQTFWLWCSLWQAK
jgi:hypothetical protein